MKPFSLILSSFLAAWFAIAAPAQASTAGTLPQDEVLAYLEQLVQWQREASLIEPSANSTRELIYQDMLQQNAITALQGGFTFARQQAAISQSNTSTPEDAAAQASTPRQRILARAEETDRQVDTLRSKLQQRSISPAQRRTLEGSLKLSLAKQELFQTVLANMSAASSSEASGLGGKINNLARDIPELNNDLGKERPAKPKAQSEARSTEGEIVTPTTQARPTNTILGIAGALFDIIRKRSALGDVVQQTETLEKRSRALLKTLRGELDEITGVETADKSIDAQVADYRQIGSVIMPLGQSLFAITASKGAVKDWGTTLNQRFDTLIMQLGIKLLLLAFMLAIPLVFGEMTKRTIQRYIPDQRRQRWAHTARRIVVGLAVVFILLLNFVSDFSSFATFAGFLTAGLAVALQGVLLSLVAHFFFYGRYGVRAGDQVNVAGVTGEIVQIGMIRFYLRELHREEDGSMKPSGKIVAFPNSILFQPVAFYKYMPEASHY